MNLYYYIQVIYLRLISRLLSVIFRFLLLINGVKFSKVSVLKGLPSLRIHPSSTVCFGSRLQFNNYDNVGWFANTKVQTLKHSHLTIGDNVGISSSLIFCSNSITIGDNVKIGGGTRIFDTDFHNMKSFKERRISSTDGPNAITKPVIIEDDVFIGTNCIIGKGVTIGARSIIAAGSVVVKNVPKDEVWGGNPARFIKSTNN